MPLQLFAYASDPVKLVNDATGKCVAGDLSLTECTGEGANEWIHVFGENGQGGEIFYAGGNQQMMCLTCTPNCTINSSIGVLPCDARGENQRFEYDGDNGWLQIPGTQVCIIANNSRTEFGSCDDSRARWSQYSECKLNTYFKTKPMKVQLAEDSGKCISTNDGNLAGLTDCASADKWEYYYDPDGEGFSRLQLVQPVGPQSQGLKCLARYTTDPLNDLPQDLPNGLTPCCDNAECTDLGYSKFYITILGGEDRDVFQWAEYDFTKNPLEPTEPFYCINIESFGVPDKQQVCTPEDEPQRWRRYEQVVDATEISVKPSLLIQKISNPEVQFQLFLFTAGKSQFWVSFA